jgi:hypothetical protein
MSGRVDYELENLRAEARVRRERLDLYRAKTYGPRPTVPGRLKELERSAEAAEARLRHAEAKAADETKAAGD